MVNSYWTWLTLRETKFYLRSLSLKSRKPMETWKDPTEMVEIREGECSLTWGAGGIITAAPTMKGTGKTHKVRGTHTYTAHEVQEGGSDGWVWLHGVVHDQDGWF